MVIYVKFLCDVACQKILKLANVSRSCSKNNTGTVFLRHGVEVQVFVPWNGVVILERVKNATDPCYRPEIPEQDTAGVNPQILTLMRQCWTEEVSERPSFDDIAKTLKSINKGKLALRLIFLLNHSLGQSTLGYCRQHRN